MVFTKMGRGAVDQAITLTNPRLRLLPICHKRLTPSVKTTIEFLSAPVRALPQHRGRVRRRHYLPVIVFAK